jgi:hypothetical protein
MIFEEILATGQASCQIRLTMTNIMLCHLHPSHGTTVNSFKSISTDQIFF